MYIILYNIFYKIIIFYILFYKYHLMKSSELSIITISLTLVLNTFKII